MKRITSLGIGLAACLTLGTAAADDKPTPQPYERPDDSWISISGTVVSPESDQFTLDYGKGVITVEMDDWDAYGDAYGLMDGDKVTVYGRVDDDLYEVAKIEASSVYVENLNTYFYASAADEEGLAYAPQYWTTATPVVVSEATIRGTVSKVKPDERTFTIDSGDSKLTVETEGMGYNPLDHFGYQQIEKGDFVSVTGQIDYEFMDGRVLEADTVTTLIHSGDES